MLAAVALLLTGCAGSGDAPAAVAGPATATSSTTATSPTEATTAAPPGAPTPTATATATQGADPDAVAGGAGEVVSFTVVDHGYEGLPRRVAADTFVAMEVAPDSTAFHQVVVHRLDDDETRSAEELAELPLDTGAAGAFGNGTLEGVTSTPVAGISAPPGGPGRVFAGGALGARNIRLREPGRYLVISTLPVDASIDDGIAAENSGIYSGLPGGPYQYEMGEIAILEVVATQ